MKKSILATCLLVLSGASLASTHEVTFNHEIEAMCSVTHIQPNATGLAFMDQDFSGTPAEMTITSNTKSVALHLDDTSWEIDGKVQDPYVLTWMVQSHQKEQGLGTVGDVTEDIHFPENRTVELKLFPHLSIAENTLAAGKATGTGTITIVCKN